MYSYTPLLQSIDWDSAVWRFWLWMTIVKRLARLHLPRSHTHPDSWCWKGGFWRLCRHECTLPVHHFDAGGDMPGVPITEWQPLPPSALLAHILPGGGCQFESLRFYCTTGVFTRRFQWQWAVIQCVGGLREWLGRKWDTGINSRAICLLSLPLNIQNSASVWLNTDTHTHIEGGRERKNDITSPWRGRVYCRLCHKLLMPSCCLSVNCMFK